MCMFVFDKVKYLKRELRADPVLGLYILGVFRYINQRLSCTKTCPRHTDCTFVTDRQISHCNVTEALKDTAFYS